MDGMIDHSSPTPLHLQLEMYLRALVEQEEYKKGKMLPGEMEISKKFGVSRNTFRAAMDRLVRDGLVSRKKGVGSFVKSALISTTLSKWESFSDEMSARGVKMSTILKTVNWTNAGAETAAEMGISENERICRLERLKGVDNEPVVLFISFFHPRVGIRHDEKFDGRLYDILENRYHSVPVVSNEEIRAISCEGELSRKLSQPDGAPMLLRKRKVLNAAQNLLELCHAYYRGDKFVYSIQIRRESV
jgi:GntR family transcriptional regulator